MVVCRVMDSENDENRRYGHDGGVFVDRNGLVAGDTSTSDEDVKEEPGILEAQVEDRDTTSAEVVDVVVSASTDQQVSFIDLATCSAADLAKQMLACSRFQEQAVDDGEDPAMAVGIAVTNFLLQAVSCIPKAHEISTRIMNMANDTQRGTEANKQEKEEVKVEDEDSNNIGAQLVEKVDGDKSDRADDDKETLSSQAISLMTPRGKFHVFWHEHGIRFRDHKKLDQFVLRAGSGSGSSNEDDIVVGDVQQCIFFPKPEDCQVNHRRKVEPTDMVVLKLHTDTGVDGQGVMFRKKQLQHICFQLPTHDPPRMCVQPSDKNNHSDEEDSDSDDDEDANQFLDHTDRWSQLLCRCLRLDRRKVARVLNPTIESNAVTGSTNSWRYQFSSYQDEQHSTTTSALPFVKCYSGVNDGVLFPLKEGLLFFKPPMFVPRQTMHSIACGRGGGDSSSRYVDVTVTVSSDKDDSDEKVLEFTNIHRSESVVLNSYIQDALIPAMKQDLASSGSPSRSPTRAAETRQESGGEQEEDGDRRGSRGTARRQASRHAASCLKRDVQQMNEESDNGGEEADDDYPHESGEDDSGEEEDSEDDGSGVEVEVDESEDDEEEEEGSETVAAEATESENEDDVDISPDVKKARLV